MKLKDILPNHYIDIEVRTYGPRDEDILFGYCHWTGTELISDDGDNYYLDEEIIKYEISKNILTYWFESDWIGY